MGVGLGATKYAHSLPGDSNVRPELDHWASSALLRRFPR
jgi:hypothetical protein